MVSDWGSTGSDFCLGLEKPVIYIDTPAKIRNHEYEHISKSAFEFEIRKQIGTIINLNNLSFVELIELLIFYQRQLFLI